MAYFVNHTVECDECKYQKTMKASSKQNMNSRLINPLRVGTKYEFRKWFAEGNVHICGDCSHAWPYIQDENGDDLERVKELLCEFGGS